MGEGADEPATLMSAALKLAHDISLRRTERARDKELLDELRRGETLLVRFRS
jgi:hypothetical protein